MTAADRWRDELAGWTIPPPILAAAQDRPWGFPPELFQTEPDSPDTPSRHHAVAVLPRDGTVVDVGCGGGAAGLALAPPAGLVTGVDDGDGMLAAFAAAATQRGVGHREVAGTWPDVADRVDPADVVVCHHVFYNVADLGPFVSALTVTARRRVVVELTAEHPMVVSGPLWRHFHDLDRPAGPTADLAVEVLRDLGLTPQSERWSRPPRAVPREAYVRLYRRRLCLPRGSEPQVDAVMGPTDRPREVVTIWWDR